VKEINKKVESLLEELNGVGNSYCKDISTIQMNHLYILISAMYKAQTKVFNLDQEVKLNFLIHTHIEQFVKFMPND